MRRHMMLTGLQLDCSNLELWPSTGECTTQVLRSGNRRGGEGLPSGDRALEESRDAFFQYYHFVFHAGLQRLALQQLERLFDGLMRQAKCCVVHGHEQPGIQCEKW